LVVLLTLNFQTMLELTKTVLKRVCFDKELFKKELFKAKKWLGKDELLNLKSWSMVTFAGLHEDLIKEVFESIM
jgi:hypothetical protein